MSVAEEKVVVDSSADESGRLNMMLDHAGFRSGRGRVAEFHSYLVDTVPDMADLPYGTARSWLSGHTPPVHKMGTIVKSLQTKISNCPQADSLVRWWKMGGTNPFTGTLPSGVEKDGIALRYNSHAFRELDIVSQAKLISALHSQAKESDFQIPSQNATLESLLDLLAFTKKEQGLQLEDPNFMKLIDALLTLMKNEVIS